MKVKAQTQDEYTCELNTAESRTLDDACIMFRQSRCEVIAAVFAVGLDHLDRGISEHKTFANEMGIF